MGAIRTDTVNVTRVDNGEDSFFMHIRSSFPYSEVNSMIEDEVAARADNFAMPGFRKGHVPFAMMKRQIKSELRSNIIMNKTTNIVADFLDKKGLSSIGEPSYMVTAIDELGDVTFEAKILLMPKIPPINLSEINLTRHIAEVDQDVIERAKRQFLSSTKEFNEKFNNNPGQDYCTKHGDRIKADVEMTIGDAEPQNNADFLMIIGLEILPSDVENALIGLKVGDIKTVEHTQQHKSKEVVKKFKFKIKSISSYDGTKIELTDELAVKYGASSVADLENQLKEKITTELEVFSRARLKKDLMDEISRIYEFEVPNALVEKAKLDVIKWLRSKKESEKRSDEDLEAEALSVAKSRVKVGFVISNIANLNSIKVTKEEIEMFIDLQRKQDPQNADKFEKFISSKENLADLESRIFEEKVVDFMLSRITIQTVTAKGDEFFMV
ncbi:Trigger factor [Candidatus Cyrtobacter comes]|uniref:Trigger factor n=1 Tax=Candidatus Cyrtobacter comes TaxID=675776 RepID=A0ABU5L6Z2_9RICK|nr:trigger factor [Candidatus Cyrtobacter comes]MDZ5761660.1 Trigger factor [Candidatus Cyrtobacter comes]